MSNKLYVGNLSYGTTDQELRDVFGAWGTVVSASLVLDRESGRSKGFAFVQFAEADSARKAMEAMNGSMLAGRALIVNEAREKPASGGRGPGGGFASNRGGGYGGGESRGGYGGGEGRGGYGESSGSNSRGGGRGGRKPAYSGDSRDGRGGGRGSRRNNDRDDW